MYRAMKGRKPSALHVVSSSSGGWDIRSSATSRVPPAHVAKLLLKAYFEGKIPALQ
jgi:hypothetical protein